MLVYLNNIQQYLYINFKLLLFFLNNLKHIILNFILKFFFLKILLLINKLIIKCLTIIQFFENIKNCKYIKFYNLNFEHFLNKFTFFHY